MNELKIVSANVFCSLLKNIFEEPTMSVAPHQSLQGIKTLALTVKIIVWFEIKHQVSGIDRIIYSLW